VRWEQLFTDLGARYEELADAEMMAELPDRQRGAGAALTMVQRCAGALGAELRVRVRSGSLHSGELRGVGANWILLGPPGGGDVLVALEAITAIEGLRAATGAPLGAVASRFDLRLALRGIARDRSPVVIGVTGTADGHAGGGAGTELSGTIDRVGADFVELAQHAMWEPRRADAVRSMLLVPLAAVDSVRALPRA
jgi:hypothetical protein